MEAIQAGDASRARHLLDLHPELKARINEPMPPCVPSILTSRNICPKPIATRLPRPRATMTRRQPF